MKRSRQKQRYRFVAPARTVVGDWRASFGKALIDAVKHLKAWDSPSLKVDVDAAVAMAFLDDVKVAGYTFETVRA